jgi:ferredoxin
MQIKKIWAAYFTGTLTTKKVVQVIAAKAAEGLKAELADYDFSLPQARSAFPVFNEGELVILGTPTYAGRVPNLLLKSLAGLKGAGALAVPVVLFGNRAYDDALVELRDILQDAGMTAIGAGAFVGEHSFSTTLGKGRPDRKDMKAAEDFGSALAQKVAGLAGLPDKPIEVKGTPKPYGGYYQPRDRQKVLIDIRKMKPVTSPDCNECKLCADICPMGAIDQSNVAEVPGICIKCCACVKRCPKGAKSFTDQGYLYHQHEMEAQYERRAEVEVFI